MIQNWLHDIAIKGEHWFSRFSESPRWMWKWAILCYAFILFFSFPDLPKLFNPGDHSIWQAVQEQIADPTAQHYIDDPESHQAKRTFRLFMPMLFKLLHTENIFLMYLLQQFAVIALLFFVLRISFRVTSDKLTTAALALAVSFLFIGQAGVVDVFGKFDTIAICGLLGAMAFRHPLLVFVFCSIAAWTDERGLLACSLVFVWWKMWENEKITFVALFRPQGSSLAVILAIGFYSGLRLYLQNKYNMQTATGLVGLDVLQSQFNMIFFGLWTGLEGLWLLFFASVAALFRQREWWLGISITLSIIILVSLSFLVVDISRSLMYLAPLIFICLLILAKTESKIYLRKLVLTSALICILVPTYFAEGGFRIEGANPLFFKVLDWMRG
jgi:hypothetical protein